MSKRLVLLLAILVVAAFAGSVSKLGTFEITLSQPTVVNGVTLKPGDYKLSVADASVTITPVEGKGKPVEAAVKIEATTQKFNNTTIMYETKNNQATIAEIDLGGRKTKVLFQ